MGQVKLGSGVPPPPVKIVVPPVRFQKVRSPTGLELQHWLARKRGCSRFGVSLGWSLMGESNGNSKMERPLAGRTLWSFAGKRDCSH